MPAAAYSSCQCTSYVLSLIFLVEKPILPELLGFVHGYSTNHNYQKESTSCLHVVFVYLLKQIYLFQSLRK